MNTRYAIATPSYAGDLERCRLLCASIDRFVTGHSVHYLLVEDRELALFRPLEGARRRVIAESELLPDWLKSWPDPTSLGRRRIWSGPGALRRGVPPLRGWHVQQLRKLALPLSCDEDVVLFADSDMMFLRPFDLARLDADGETRLFVKPDGITPEMTEHAAWCAMAANLFGLPAPSLPTRDYIGNLVSWRRDNARAMIRAIEQRSGRDWVSAVASQRRFSEYIIYGFFVEQVLGLAAARHAPDTLELCKVYWGGDTAGLHTLVSFEEVLGEGQVAVGVQSFIGEPMERLQALFAAQAA